MDIESIKRYLTKPEYGNINLWLSIDDVTKIHEIMSQSNKMDLVFQIYEVSPLQWELVEGKGQDEVLLNGNNLFYYKSNLEMNKIDINQKSRVELTRKDKIWEQFF